ncbi:MAG: hypothetical protein IPJ65_19845 [Archangiaceae bacterium]|nr:hypothetical protein [Archangiaceae bacterium]
MTVRRTARSPAGATSKARALRADEARRAGATPPASPARGFEAGTAKPEPRELVPVPAAALEWTASTGSPPTPISLPGQGAVDGLLHSSLWAATHPLGEDDEALEPLELGSFALEGVDLEHLSALEAQTLRVAISRGWFTAEAAAQLAPRIAQAAAPSPAGEASDAHALVRAFWAENQVQSLLGMPDALGTSRFVGLLHTLWAMDGGEGLSPLTREVLEDEVIPHLAPAKLEMWLATQLCALQVRDGQVTRHAGTEGALPFAPARTALAPISRQLAPTEVASELISQVIATPTARPDAVELFAHVQHGLTAQAVLTAAAEQGVRVELSPDTLFEARTLTPYLKEVVEQLEQDHPGSRLLYLARDGELLSDLQDVLSHARGQPSPGRYFPGSGGLFANTPGTPLFEQRMNVLERLLESPELTAQLGDDLRALTRELFAQHGVDAKLLEGAGLVLVDSGFMGSIGWKVRATLSEVLGLDHEQVERAVPMRLVSSETEDAPFNSTIRFFPQPDRPLAELLPRLHVSAVEAFAGKQRVEDFNFALASSLQMLPHAHGPYHFLTRLEGKAIAVPDRVPDEDGDEDRLGAELNPTSASPVAALAVQVQVLQELARLLRE